MDEFYLPQEAEDMLQEQAIETEQYWSVYPQWDVETGYDVLWL